MQDLQYVSTCRDGDSHSDRQPMQWRQNRRDMFLPSNAVDEASVRDLCSLKSICLSIVQQNIAVDEV